MTNPNNAVGTNGAYGGRTSVNALNDVLATFNGRGILSGWAVAPDQAMTLSIGGESGVRDVAIAEDNMGNKTTINNISKSPISITLEAAPSVNSRIDAIVAYVANPPAGSATQIDNPAAAGLIAVVGNTATTPTAPNDSAIRAAITADGASGTTAYYVVLANITVASGTTVITADMIAGGIKAGIASANIDLSTLAFGNYSTVEQDTGFVDENGNKIYVKTVIYSGAIASGITNIPHGISNFGHSVKTEVMYLSSTASLQLPAIALDANTKTISNAITTWSVNSTQIAIYSTIATGANEATIKIRIFYVKN